MQKDNKLDISIKLHDSGFYKGFSRPVTLISKALVGLLVIWAIVFPEQAASVLGNIQSFTFSNFNSWYMYVVGSYIIFCLIFALYPCTSKVNLGTEDEKPEFSTFSWFSMMFGAGIGIGMIGYAAGEPLFQWGSNPDTIMGNTVGLTEGNIRAAYQWSFLHWGLSAWGTYALTGLALAYFSFNRGLPLTIRSGISSLFSSKTLSGGFGHFIDITAVVATVVGVSYTIGLGVTTFASGLFNISGAEWLRADDSPSTLAILFSLIVVMCASTLSALSGVGKGIKWLSNINMVLSFFVLIFFLMFGSTFFVLKTFIVGVWDYIVALPSMSFVVWQSDGVEGSVATQLNTWQSSWWTVFYWAWWIAFAPFVGLFLARISRGRTIREYILGAMIVPALMCFLWFAVVGGTAIDLDLQSLAGGGASNIYDSISAKGVDFSLYATVNQLLGDGVGAILMSMVIVILLLTYLVTSADSAVLIINTINSGGDESQKGKTHIVVWGVALGLVISALILIGGLDAIKTAMIVGALPFSVVLALMGIALIKSLIIDTRK